MRIWTIAVLMLFAGVVMAQKVKEKNDIWYVDGNEYLKMGCKNFYAGPCPMSTADGSKLLFSVISYPYKKKIKVNEGNGWFEKEINDHFFEFRFLDSDAMMNSMGEVRGVIKNMYNFGLIADDGTIDPDKLDQFIKIYHEEPPIRVSEY